MYIPNDATGIESKELYKQFLKAVKRKQTGIGKLFKSKITIEEAKSIEGIFLKAFEWDNLDFLKYFPQMESLIIGDCRGLENIEGLRHVPNLKELAFYNTSVEDLRPIAYCPHIESFEYMVYEEGVCKREDFYELKWLRELELVDLSGNDIKDASFLNECKRLKEVVLSENPLESIESLSALPFMEWLEVEKCQLQNLDGIEEMTALKSLYATENCFTEEQKAAYKEAFAHFERLEI